MDHNTDFVKILTQWNTEFDEHILEQFEKYYDLLISWNKKINLTAITEKNDVYIKHFADSIAMLQYTDISGKTLIDVGSGAGFPGIPLSIMDPSCKVVLIDSLRKRTDYLETVKLELGLSNVTIINGRAEDLARDEGLREKSDIAVSRAVADLSVLSEYCLPFVNINGTFISYKSGNVDDEAESARGAIDILGGKTDRIERYVIPFTDYERSLVYINKISSTIDRYPRRAGKPEKSPLH